MLLVEVIEISVIQTKQVLRRGSDFVVDDIPADDGTQVRIYSNYYNYFLNGNAEELCLIY